MQRHFATRIAAPFAAAATLSAGATLLGARRTVVEEFNGSHDEFTAKVSKGHTVVDCFTDWCAPCKMVAPHFAELSEKFTNVKFIKINVEENEDVGAMLNVRSIPYFVLFEDGKSVGAVEGANVQKLTQLIESAGQKKE